MMKDLIKYEIRKNFAPFGVLIAFNIIMALFITLNKDKNMSLIIQSVNGIAGIILALYTFKEFYEDFYEGKYELTHLIPVKLSKVVFAKIIVFFLGFLLFYVSGLFESFFSDYGNFHKIINESPSPAAFIMFNILGKIASYISGLALLAFSLGFSKLLTGGKGWGIIILALTISIITAMLVVTSAKPFLETGKNHAVSFEVTIQSSDGASVDYVQYAAFLPLKASSSTSRGSMTVNISWISIVNNLIATIVLLPLGAIFFNSKRYEPLDES
jgi:hypothetical protein